MAMKLIKKVLLPLVIFFGFAIFISRSSQHWQKQQQYNSTPIHIPIPHRFKNNSNVNAEASGQSQTQRTERGQSTLRAYRNKLPPVLLQLGYCSISPNKYTNHIRLPNQLYNISMWARHTLQETRSFWNPTIFALPYWSKNQYLIVTMVHFTNQGFRQNVLCEANICVPKHAVGNRINVKVCSDDDLKVLGSNGGMRCETTPMEVKVPPTPAYKCQGPQKGLEDIPGFHDPRIFYSARGEPVLMVASQSRYACIGVWAIDLRSVYPSLNEVFSSSPRRLGPGPLASYPVLTELTRNPPATRRSYEKNWLIFSPNPPSTYIQYELTSSQRTFAKLVGDGFTTTNMTDPLEIPCLIDATPEEISRNQYMANATWHQATPALKLILCTRMNTTCISETPDTVFMAIIHRKHKNLLDLPIRYERYVVIWATTPPFNMLAVSRHPILFANETTTGWSAEESWDDLPEARAEGRGFWAKLTYTTTIAYAWGREEGDIREKGIGYIDDEIILSVGVDDHDQVYGRVLVSKMLQCLRVCPGVVR